MSADEKLIETAFEREAKNIAEANLDLYDEWHAERGVETSRAYWKKRAEASEAKIAALTAENATLREKVERAAEDQLDRLYLITVRLERTTECQHLGLLKDKQRFLLDEGAMLPSARAALRQEGKP